MKERKIHKIPYRFVLKTYEYTKGFLKDELFGLTSQIRRAVISIAANIVEGQGSCSKKDFLNFLNMANRSLVETEYLIETAGDLSYLTEQQYVTLEAIRYKVGILLNGLICSIRAKL